MIHSLGGAVLAALLLLDVEHTVSFQLPRARLRTTPVRRVGVLPLPAVSVVDANGEVVPDGTTDAFRVRETTVNLPVGMDVTPSLELEAYDVERAAKALVLEPAEAKAAAAVVFLHGFSQQPANYSTLLRSLAASGLRVVAPTTWLLDVIWPWVNVVTATSPLDFSGKLQTAMIIDGLRSMKLLQDEGFKTISLMGHSMGGACALVIPSILDNKAVIASTFVMSPAAGASCKTTLNPYLTKGEQHGLDLALATELFGAYDTDPRVALVSAKGDYIVRADQVGELYKACEAGAMAPKSALAALRYGRHVGFEDSLQVQLPFGKIKLFSVLSFLIYGMEAFEFILGDLDDQLDATKVLANRMLAAFGGAKDISDLVRFQNPVSDWDAVLELTTTGKEISKALIGRPPPQ